MRRERPTSAVGDAAEGAPGHVCVVLRFDSKEAARAWCQSTEYLAAKEIRTANTDGVAVTCGGFVMPSESRFPTAIDTFARAVPRRGEGSPRTSDSSCRILTAMPNKTTYVRDSSAKPTRVDTTRGVPRRLPIGWAVFAGFVGPALAAVCVALEPAPAKPNAPEPLIATLLGFALLVAWSGAAVTAGRRRPSALGWASVVGGLSMALTISCPLSGHHTSIGLWWVGQFVVSGAAWAAAAVGKYHLDRA